MEEALRAWENYLFLTTTIGLEGENIPKTAQKEVNRYLPLRTHEFRRHLLSSLNRDFAPEEVFGASHIYDSVSHRFGLSYVTLPQILWSWNQRSRRSYTLTTDLQLELAGTTLSDVRVSDIAWPFDTFGISLPEPISLGYGYCKYDYVIASRNEHLQATKTPETTVILLLCQHLAGAKYMPPEDRKRVIKKARKGRGGIGQFLSQYQTNRFSNSCVSMMCIGSMDEFFVDSLSKHIHDASAELENERQKKHFTTVVNRIVFGLCLYISSLDPQEKRDVLRWSKDVKVKSGTIPHKPETITDESEVCMVTSIRSISTRERDWLRQFMQNERIASLPGPHFCQGHWRRPPGDGDDPSAEKTVWVRPYYTGREELGANELPGGAIMKTK